MILGDFVFNGRKKRPPPDPVNALLSFTDTLIFNEISSLLDGMGFDPYLGYLHKPDYGRPSLACDLIEKFRSIAGDRLVLKRYEKFNPTPFLFRKRLQDAADARRTGTQTYFLYFKYPTTKQMRCPVNAYSFSDLSSL